MQFNSRADEDYSDEDALGYMMDCKCSSCGHEVSVLMVSYEYQEMIRMAETQSCSEL